MCWTAWRKNKMISDGFQYFKILPILFVSSIGTHMLQWSWAFVIGHKTSYTSNNQSTKNRTLLCLFPNNQKHISKIPYSAQPISLTSSYILDWEWCESRNSNHAPSAYPTDALILYQKGYFTFRLTDVTSADQRWASQVRLARLWWRS